MPFSLHTNHEQFADTPWPHAQDVAFAVPRASKPSMDFFASDFIRPVSLKHPVHSAFLSGPQEIQVGMTDHYQSPQHFLRKMNNIPDGPHQHANVRVRVSTVFNEGTGQCSGVSVLSKEPCSEIAKGEEGNCKKHAHYDGEKLTRCKDPEGDGEKCEDKKECDHVPDCKTTKDGVEGSDKFGMEETDQGKEKHHALSPCKLAGGGDTEEKEGGGDSGDK